MMQLVSGDPSDYRYKAKSGWSNPSEQMTAGENSITEYGGFYVARYEAGVPSNASFYVPSNESGNEATYGVTYETSEERNKSEENGKQLKPVSKKGNQAWNFINQTNAKMVSERMYDNSSVKSYLIDSKAWNYICKNIFETEEGKNISNSTTYGNYNDNTTTNYEEIKGLFAKHSYSDDWTYADKYKFGNIPTDYIPKSTGINKLELATGICDDFKIYNIYDMAGNMWEWTAETVNAPYDESISGDYAVFRGGGFNHNGVDHPVVRSNGNYYVTDCDVIIGFRVVLYIK